MAEHRQHLAKPGNDYLFPNEGTGGRSGHDIAIGMIKRIKEDIGVGFNMHLMRHLAVLRFLNTHPGQYEIVRAILGHRKVSTTIAFYAGLETDAAIRLFMSVINKDRRNTSLMAADPTRKISSDKKGC